MSFVSVLGYVLSLLTRSPSNPRDGSFLVKSQLRRAFTEKNVEARVPESPESANDSSLDLATLSVFRSGVTPCAGHGGETSEDIERRRDQGGGRGGLRFWRLRLGLGGLLIGLLSLFCVLLRPDGFNKLN